MKNQVKVVLSVMLMGIFSGCVPAVQPQIRGIGGALGTTVPSQAQTQPLPLPPTEVVDREYGAKPTNYISAIRSYSTNKIPRANLSQFKYGKPKRAYKRKGFAYGGAVAWKGWLVEATVATPTRTGRLLTPKPYMFLFSGGQVVEHILGNTHKLIIKVDK